MAKYAVIANKSNNCAYCTQLKRTTEFSLFSCSRKSKYATDQEPGAQFYRIFLQIGAFIVRIVAKTKYGTNLQSANNPVFKGAKVTTNIRNNKHYSGALSRRSSYFIVQNCAPLQSSTCHSTQSYHLCNSPLMH